MKPIFLDVESSLCGKNLLFPPRQEIQKYTLPSKTD